MLAGHRVELAPALGRQPDRVYAAVARQPPAYDEALADELVRQPGHVAPRHHQAARQLAHPQALRRPRELRHEIEARERDVEALAQALPDVALEHRRAREQPQPQAQRGVIGRRRPRFGIDRQRLEHHRPAPLRNAAVRALV